MTLDIIAIGQWVTFILALISLIGTAKNHFSGGTKENTEAIKLLEDKHGRLDMRVQKIENELKHLPSKDDFTKLSVSFAKVETKMEAMVKTMEATERACRRVEDFLRSGKRTEE